MIGATPQGMDRSGGSRVVAPTEPTTTNASTSNVMPVSDPNLVAATKLANVGVAASCQTVNTNNQGGNFNQNVCTVPGSQQVYDANLTAALSPAQLQAVLAQEFAVVGRPSSAVLATTPAAPIDSPVFNSPSNTAVNAAVSVVPTAVVSQAALVPTVGYSDSDIVRTPISTAPATTTTNGQNTSVSSGVDFVTWLKGLVSTPSTSSSNVASSSSVTTTTSAASGPGITYNDINPDGTAVTSSTSGLLTDMFAFLDAGVSIGGTNIPFWFLTVAGLGAIWMFRKAGDSETGRKLR